VLTIIGAVVIISGICIAWLNYSAEQRRKETEQRINTEKERLQQIVSEANQYAQSKNYESALIALNNINWQYEPSTNKDYVELYSKQREDLRQTIITLKNEQDSIAKERSNQLSEHSEDLITYDNKSFINPDDIILNSKMAERAKDIIKNQDEKYLIKYEEGGTYSLTRKITNEKFRYEVAKERIIGYTYSTNSPFNEYDIYFKQLGFNNEVDKHSYRKNCLLITTMEEEGPVSITYSSECD
jgi:hypothetical protein